ncbi:MAG: cyclic nucleotide-binding protein [Gammaproteobacteria bacterium HGW-Gammaproteobacteria-11]|nr:MAG: cyclic nucleotide-binding protein [Gammaproteobacteria bacterium HGW-Gammaproteobacteria-11]
MQIELIEIRDHLSRFPPFEQLPEEELERIAGQIEIRYFQAGSEIVVFDQPIFHLHYIRSGAVEVYRRNGELYNRLSEGDIFGQFGLLRSNRVRFPAKALEDALIYLIPEQLFHQLCEHFVHFADFVEAEGQSRLQKAVAAQDEAAERMQVRVSKLLNRRAVSVSASCTVQAAAQAMSEASVSSLLIMAETADGSVEPSMVGIMTDRDFRNRVIAQGLGYDVPIGEVMTANPVTLQDTDSVFDAMLTMLRFNIHHLPIVRRERAMGVINLADIIRFETQSSLYLVNSIFNCTSANALQDLLPDVQATFARMAKEASTANMIGRAMSSIGRNLTQRLIELAELELGPAPIPYCFMALGSMARDEQLIVTDQDNALVLDNRFDPAIHDDYFMQLAARVSDGLAACGYSYCKGGIMATNPEWRQPLRVWQGYFRDWIAKPNPQTLLNSSIFFDLDPVHGEPELVIQLQQQVAEQASKSPAFLASLARNALNRTPPLGFFRTFVMEKDGKQNNIINLKGRGTAPLTDLIRVHALACGSLAQNSSDRLDDIAKTKLLTSEAIAGLRAALECLSSVRIRHQAWQLEHGEEPNNYIEPEALMAAERHSLKEAFQVVSNAQKFLRFRYPSGGAERSL